MKQYRIRRQGETMVIIDRESGDVRAEYRLTPGCERREVAAMRRSIDRHLSTPNATLGNYQW